MRGLRGFVLGGDMIKLKRLVDLSIVADVLQSPTRYADTRNGFAVDRAKLRADVETVSVSLNEKVRKYGNEKYAS